MRVHPLGHPPGAEAKREYPDRGGEGTNYYFLRPAQRSVTSKHAFVLKREWAGPGEHDAGGRRRRTPTGGLKAAVFLPYPLMLSLMAAVWSWASPGAVGEARITVEGGGVVLSGSLAAVLVVALGTAVVASVAAATRADSRLRAGRAQETGASSGRRLTL